ncbi:sigma-E factor negative regulatory protein [Dyella sp. A6]|uniref:sigma-E factor negative regulatory protein n=1 Tax=Dyella aluminiiresistens TaxID=3069105 RepID=UPI002E79E1ED|nr:sigma-E factor negative regulatory protein [Dyella sp. A6]
MTESHRENLSAGVDGELSREELRFLLRRLDHDAALLDAWSRHHVARDGLRKELPLLASSGFAARVMLTIEAESSAVVSTGSTAVPHARRRWLHWSAGGAIAAGVAAVALMVAQPTGDSGVRGASPQMASMPPAAAPQARQQVADVSLARRQPASAAAPAVVPPWLSANAASQLSERASLTLGDPNSDAMRPYRVRGYRTLSTGDGSYLLLIDPNQAANRSPMRQAASAQ